MDKSIKSKIEKLKKKQESLKARIQLIENREKAKERKLDTRKKILVGSYFIEKYSEDKKEEELTKLMNQYLTRQSDRKVFGLSYDEKTLKEKAKQQ